jgi:hypothetical protein
MYSEAAAMDIGTLAFCPFCRSNCYWNEDPRLNMVLCICPTCGKFRFSSMSIHYLSGFSNTESARIYKISFALRSVSEKALGKRDNSFFPAYSSDDLKKMLDQAEPPVQEKLILLLKHLGHLTEYPGQLNEFDMAHDYAVSVQEMHMKQTSISSLWLNKS